MNVLNAEVDPDKYADACTVKELDLKDFDSTDMYFEYPLLPRHGGQHQARSLCLMFHLLVGGNGNFVRCRLPPKRSPNR